MKNVEPVGHSVNLLRLSSAAAAAATAAIAAAYFESTHGVDGFISKQLTASR